jgi:hypothetical protein
MGRVLSLDPVVPSYLRTFTLGGTDYRIALTWRERTGSWYLDLYDAEEAPLALGRRVSPGWSPLLGLDIDGGPEGMLFVRGPEPYRREDLGAGLRIIFYPTSENPDPTPSDDDPTVVLVTP